MRRRRFQFVWWGWRDWRLGWGRFGYSLGVIYRWWVRVGPLEIRRWAPTRPSNPEPRPSAKERSS